MTTHHTTKATRRLNPPTYKKHPPIYYTVRTVVRAVFVATLALVMFTIGKALATDPYGYKCDGTTAVAADGDSLWSLAQKHCTGHIGQAVTELVKVYGTQIDYGQRITLDGERK